MDAMVSICNGESTAQVRATYAQAYKWRKSYALVNNGVGGFLIVDRPDNAFGLNGDGDDIEADVDYVVKLTYFESVTFRTTQKDKHSMHGSVEFTLTLPEISQSCTQRPVRYV